MRNRLYFTATSTSLLYAVIFHKLLTKSHSYDIGCIYPPELGDNPIQTRFDFGGKLTMLTSSLPHENEMTQPFMARWGLYITGCTALCLAYHYPDVRDPFNGTPTFMTVPPFGQNAYSVTMCQAQCWQHIFADYYDMMPQMKDYFHGLGLNVTDPSERSDIEYAVKRLGVLGTTAPIMTILESEDFHPFTVGHIAGTKIRFRMNYDGFNQNGDRMWSRTTERQVPCTANCIPYQDTTGYQPVPDPRVYSYLNIDSSKYDCTGLCRYWQPEQNGGTPTGTISRKEFALPHIGKRAKTYLRDVTLTLEDPNYDYYKESLLVVKRLGETSSDEMKKLMIKLFRGQPNKGIHGLRGPLHTATNVKFMDQISYEDNMLLFFALSLIEYDGIIQVWKEKRFHDLVRPTTVIKQWDNDMLHTFGGDIDYNGPIDISARNVGTFLPSIDASPEFPSLHSCFCTTLMEFMDLYLDHMYGGTLQNFTVVVPGG